MENNNGMTEEKRRHPRAEFNLPLSYKNLRSAGQPPIGSTSSNISEGGIRFKTNEFISLACRMVLEITLPTTPKPIKAISKVAWIKKLPTSNFYEIGNQFLEISKEDRAHIMEFVKNTVKASPHIY